MQEPRLLLLDNSPALMQLCNSKANSKLIQVISNVGSIYDMIVELKNNPGIFWIKMGVFILAQVNSCMTPT